MEDHEIKEKILEGSEKLFMKYGVRSITMDDIARHLSVSKKTLYQYFVDKDELVMMVSKKYMAANKARHDEMVKTSENAIDELHKLSVCMRESLGAINAPLLFDIQKYHPKAWSIWQTHKLDFIYNSVVRNLKQGIKDGHFREDLNPHIIASLRMGIIEMCFDEKIFPPARFNLAEVHVQVFEHFVFGLTTEKGKKLYLKYKENYIHSAKTNPLPHETIL
ncbi:MAG: TetR/AcrR family transcriptional regulator [Bacteroidetes bacterium]|nr:TetR/AcrR family transcriptional regulator [Bacteroidota bacterium]MBS1539859.1 TetR/AcrR family transcriptional regulator [Bacteroidota bacterium]